MPLSDHEQRLLEQIERALYADDPKFAASVRTTDLRRHYRARLIRSLAALLFGLAVMVFGVIDRYWYVGVAGFAIMLLAAMRGATVVTRLTGGRLIRGAPRPARNKAVHTPVRDRFEERWRRRFEDRGGR